MYFTLFATVVVFIGLLNLLPFPPLDGGHVAIALIEKVRGKRIDMKKVVPVSAVVLRSWLLLDLRDDPRRVEADPSPARRGPRYAS